MRQTAIPLILVRDNFQAKLQGGKASGTYAGRQEVFTGRHKLIEYEYTRWCFTVSHYNATCAAADDEDFRSRLLKLVESDVKVFSCPLQVHEQKWSDHLLAAIQSTIPIRTVLGVDASSYSMYRTDQHHRGSKRHLSPTNQSSPKRQHLSPKRNNNENTGSTETSVQQRGSVTGRQPGFSDSLDLNVTYMDWDDM